mmetsp:Transcript_31559/g.95390  ORF Transcript_31559/g.95390 Transcript_31559/m.95390 type:complete len:200 (+) Transcript_31559:214-813(+)
MQKAASQGTLGHTVQAVPCARRQGYCENANKNLAPVLKGRACDWSVPGRCAQTRWVAMGSSSAFGRGLRGSRIGLRVLGFLRSAVIQIAAATRVLGFLRLRVLGFLRLGSLASCVDAVRPFRRLRVQAAGNQAHRQHSQAHGRRVPVKKDDVQQHTQKLADHAQQRDRRGRHSGPGIPPCPADADADDARCGQPRVRLW